MNYIRKYKLYVWYISPFPYVFPLNSNIFLLCVYCIELCFRKISIMYEIIWKWYIFNCHSHQALNNNFGPLDIGQSFCRASHLFIKNQVYMPKYIFCLANMKCIFKYVFFERFEVLCFFINFSSKNGWFVFLWHYIVYTFTWSENSSENSSHIYVIILCFFKAFILALKI